MIRSCLLPLVVAALSAGICLRAAAPKPPAKADVSAVVKGNNRFALDLYGKLRGKEGNLFFSPFSISSALAMTSAGARGKTLDEMQHALRFPAQKTLHPALGHLLRQFNADPKTRPYHLNVANALWGQKGYKFKDDFLKINKDHYGAGLQLVDYKKDAEGSREAINGWVEKHTDGQIKNLLLKGALTDVTRLVLVNAIYFQSQWAHAFPPGKTKDQNFHLLDGKTVKVPLMHLRVTAEYAATKEVEILQFPYISGAAEMVVLLPKKGGLAAFEKGLTNQKIDKWLVAAVPRPVEIYLPRFKFSSTFQLPKTLGSLGMKRAFGATANFSGMDGTKVLYLSDVVHKAFVEVDEKGTKAAAATAVVVAVRSSLGNPATFSRADRPFVFLIRDIKSGTVLFLGRVVNPKGS